MTWSWTDGLGYQPVVQPTYAGLIADERPTEPEPAFFQQPLTPQLREQLDELALVNVGRLWDVRCTDCEGRSACCRDEPEPRWRLGNLLKRSS